MNHRELCFLLLVSTSFTHGSNVRKGRGHDLVTPDAFQGIDFMMWHDQARPGSIGMEEDARSLGTEAHDPNNDRALSASILRIETPSSVSPNDPAAPSVAPISSEIDSIFPSWMPSDFPSDVVPIDAPYYFSAPYERPHVPTSVPSESSSVVQSISPSQRKPTNFPMEGYPTQLTSPFPNIGQSLTPSHETSDAPNTLQSDVPSAVPTNSVFITIPIDENGDPLPEGSEGEGGLEGNGLNSTDPTGEANEGYGALLSTCSKQPENELEAIDAVYGFQYVMVLEPSGDADSIVKKIEPIIHNMISDEFLTCDFDDRRRMKAEHEKVFSMINMSSLPIDKVADVDCEPNDAEHSDDGFKCFVINSGFSSKLFISASPEQVLQVLGNYFGTLIRSDSFLNVDSSIHRLAFRGFAEGMVTVTPPPPVDNEPIENGVQSASTVEYVVDSWGGIVAVVAAAAIAGVLLLLIVRRRSKHERHSKNIDAGSLDSSDADSGTYLSPGTLRSADDSPKFIVHDCGIERTFSDEDQEVIASYQATGAVWAQRHDARTCKSTTCPICQADLMLLPSFVPAEVMAAHTERDLGPPPRLDPRRGSSPADTVIL